MTAITNNIITEKEVGEVSLLYMRNIYTKTELLHKGIADRRK